MPNDQEMKDALLRQFRDQVDLWNGTNYDRLAERFDVNIIMKKLDDPDSVMGIGNVLTYLNNNQRPKAPQFTDVYIQDTFIWGEGKVAQITGTANSGCGGDVRSDAVSRRFEVGVLRQNDRMVLHGDQSLEQV